MPRAPPTPALGAVTGDRTVPCGWGRRWSPPVPSHHHPAGFGSSETPVKRAGWGSAHWGAEEVADHDEPCQSAMRAGQARQAWTRQDPDLPWAEGRLPQGIRSRSCRPRTCISVGGDAGHDRGTQLTPSKLPHRHAHPPTHPPEPLPGSPSPPFPLHPPPLPPTGPTARGAGAAHGAGAARCLPQSSSPAAPLLPPRPPFPVLF